MAADTGRGEAPSCSRVASTKSMSAVAEPPHGGYRCATNALTCRAQFGSPAPRAVPGDVRGRLSSVRVTLPVEAEGVLCTHRQSKDNPPDMETPWTR